MLTAGRLLRRAAVLVLLLSPAAVFAAPALETAVLREINSARVEPQAYAEALREYRKRFRGKIIDFPEEGVPLLTSEGVAAVDEAIAFLERQAPLPPLVWGDVLALAASDHAAGQRGGTVGHVGTDRSSPGDRVQRRGGGPYIGETIAYGSTTGKAVVRQFIIDDGVADRGHRKMIFDSGFRYAGVGCGPHARFGAMCVVDYAETVDGRSRWE